jgi:hypothetical protein
MKTSELCTAGNVIGQGLPVSEALNKYGVYRFRPFRSAAALVVTTDGVAYVNDNYVVEYNPSIHPSDKVWLTDLPCPVVITR